MKFRLALSLFLIAFFGALMFSQVSMVNSASRKSKTQPITTPITYFKVGGKVYYQRFKTIRPIQGAVIELINLTTNEKFYAKTDNKGNYSFYVRTGKYQLKAIENKMYYFIPSVTYLWIDKDILNLNFLGVSKLIV